MRCRLASGLGSPPPDGLCVAEAVRSSVYGGDDAGPRVQPRAHSVRRHRIEFIWVLLTFDAGDAHRRRKAMAQQLCIECKWLRNIQTESNNYVTGQPGVVSTRGASLTAEQQGELPQPQPKASAGACVSMCVRAHRWQQNQRVGRINKPQLPAGTWPRPEPVPHDPEAARKAMEAMRESAAANKRAPTGASGPLSTHVFRSEVEGRAIDMALSRVAGNMRVQPYNLSRSIVRSVQKSVASAVSRFDTRFVAGEFALARLDELQTMVNEAIDVDIDDFRDVKSASVSDVDALSGSSVPVLMSACGKVSDV